MGVRGTDGGVKNKSEGREWRTRARNGKRRMKAKDGRVRDGRVENKSEGWGSGE